MSEETSEKREDIIKNNYIAVSNYCKVKKDAEKVKGELDNFVIKIDENINRLNKSNKLLESLPQEQLSNPSPELIYLIDSGSEFSESIRNHSDQFKDNSQRIGDEITSLMGSAVVVDASGNAMLSISSSIAISISQEYPQINTVIEDLKLPTPHEKRKQLESELREIDERIAHLYVGAWQTINDTSKKDRFRQASHSMRELLSQFLDLLSPAEEVINSEWYEPEHTSKKPTQRQRAKYAMVGKRSEKMRDEDIEMIHDIAANARNIYTNLNKISHTRDDECCILAVLCIEQCEEVIRSILELRKKFHISS